MRKKIHDLFIHTYYSNEMGCYITKAKVLTEDEVALELYVNGSYHEHQIGYDCLDEYEKCGNWINPYSNGIGSDYAGSLMDFIDRNKYLLEQNRSYS